MKSIEFIIHGFPEELLKLQGCVNDRVWRGHPTESVGFNVSGTNMGHGIWKVIVQPYKLNASLMVVDPTTQESLEFKVRDSIDFSVVDILERNHESN